MATIKRYGARTFLAESKPQPSISNLGTDGLRLRFILNDPAKGYQYEVALSQYDYEVLREAWDRLLKDFET